MITEDLFLSKISEMAHLKCITLTKSAAKEVYPRFKEFQPEDLSKAIDSLAFEDSRFDFIKLLKKCSTQRSIRIEEESQHSKDQERKTAYEFFHPQFNGECTIKHCPGCRHKPNCSVRAHEWLKGINTILSGKRAPGEGTQMAKDIISYMQKDFMQPKEEDQAIPF